MRQTQRRASFSLTKTSSILPNQTPKKGKKKILTHLICSYFASLSTTNFVKIAVYELLFAILTMNVTLSLRFDSKFYNKNKFVWEQRFEN